MTYSANVWTIEEAELRDTATTCVPSGLPPGARLGSVVWFDSKRELLDAVGQTFSEMLRRPDEERHLLVISAHGKQRTGTYIEVSREVHGRRDEHAPFFAIRPASVVTIVAACWGGYPSRLIIGAIGSSRTACPLKPGSSSAPPSNAPNKSPILRGYQNSMPRLAFRWVS